MAELTLSDLGRIAHEANRTLQAIQADPTIPVSVGWDDLDPESKMSLARGVAGVLDGNGPEQSHGEWLAFKKATGWHLGPVKDEGKREHPLLVPYAELPEAAKLKDALFVGIVRALAQ